MGGEGVEWQACESVDLSTAYLCVCVHACVHVCVCVLVVKFSSLHTCTCTCTCAKAKGFQARTGIQPSAVYSLTMDNFMSISLKKSFYSNSMGQVKVHESLPYRLFHIQSHCCVMSLV